MLGYNWKTEFIHNHEATLKDTHKVGPADEPPWYTVCKSVGLKADASVRLKIIKSIGRGNNYSYMNPKSQALTVQIVHVTTYPLHVYEGLPSFPAGQPYTGGYSPASANGVVASQISGVSASTSSSSSARRAPNGPGRPPKTLAASTIVGRGSSDGQ